MKASQIITSALAISAISIFAVGCKGEEERKERREEKKEQREERKEVRQEKKLEKAEEKAKEVPASVTITPTK